MNNGINYIDLFAGIGGFAKGIENAGIKIKNHYYSEIDKYCINIYEKYFPEAKALGDIKTIKPEDISKLKKEKIDLITFGFPCQDLSIAGKRIGLNGNRSGLFFEAIRVIKEIQPTYFIFENVKGLVTNNRGKDFIRCLQEISNIGLYDCEWQLINTKWFLPQNRERIYFIGHFRGKSKFKVFPIRENDFKTSFLQRQQTSSSATTNTITTRTGTSKGSGTYVVESQLHEKTGVYVIPVITPNRLNKRQNGRRFKTDGEPSFTLTTQDQHGICIIENNNMNPLSIRRLTPIECERLQGFPDNWTKIDKLNKEIKDTNRYKMIGNAVTVNVVEKIIERLFNFNNQWGIK